MYYYLALEICCVSQVIITSNYMITQSIRLCSLSLASMISRYKKQDSGPTTLQKKIFLARISFDFTSLRSVSSHSTSRSSYFFCNSFSFTPPSFLSSLLLASSFILREIKRNVVNPESCFLYLLQYPIKILFKNSIP